jgi:hypothetical protein
MKSIPKTGILIGSLVVVLALASVVSFVRIGLSSAPSPKTTFEVEKVGNWTYLNPVVHCSVKGTLISATGRYTLLGSRIMWDKDVNARYGIIVVESIQVFSQSRDGHWDELRQNGLGGGFPDTMTWTQEAGFTKVPHGKLLCRIRAKEIPTPAAWFG